MSEAEKGSGEVGSSADAEAGGSNPPKKRKSKKCSQCQAYVQNLSRHQKEVHGMTKIRRKLSEYLTGEKKPPRGKVKFCPLSPCKRHRTPIFQLHKHLQSNVHKLKQGSPSYVSALGKAKRVALKDFDSYLKEKRKKREDSRKTRDSNEDAQTDEDKSLENDGGLDPREQNTSKMLKTGGLYGRVPDCHERKEFEKSQDESSDSEQENAREEEYEALARRSRENEKDKFNRVQKRPNSDKERKLEEERMEKAQEEKRVSDEEYDDLAERVWNTHESNRASFSNVTRLPRVKSGEECMHSDKNHEDLQNSEDITSMEVPEIVTLSDSDEATEYDPYDDSDTDESSEVQWTETSSSLSQECDQLMTELVEVIGKDNCQNDSFLDNEEPWKKVVNRFINVKTSEGFTFKTPAESANVCRQDLEEMEQCSQEDLFKELFQEYASDNDDALEEWVASDCETDGVQTSCEREPELNRENVSMDHDDDLLAEFYMWLVDVDGGYRNEKIAQQYKNQVRNVIHRLTLTEAVTTERQEKRPSVQLLLIPGKDGDTFLKSWLSYAVNRYQPGTVQSYLMSLRLFYKFLIQEQKDIANVTLETLNARRDLMSSWSAAQKKKVAKRKLEKRDEDFKKLLSSEHLFQICHGNQRVNAIKQLASSSEPTDGVEDASKVLSDKSHCEVRDWLMTRLLIDNSGRSGVAANMKISEFKEAVYYPGTDEDPARYRILVNDHKTAGVYGAAVVWVHDDLYKLVEMYLRTVRSQITSLAPHVEQVFVSSNGMPLTSSQVSTCVYRTVQREGIETNGRICATTVRKSLATGMHVHMPEEKDHLAALSLHKTKTQADYYRVHDKVNETDLGRRAVQRLVSLKTENIHHAKVEKPTPWTEEEVSGLKDLFKEEIATGAINEGEIIKKVSTENILKAHSVKAIVLKLRRMSDEFRKDIPLPTEQETSTERVLKFLSSAPCESDKSGPVHAPSLASATSTFWRKFTDEQTSHLLSLTQDLVKNNAVKREDVWQRVKDDARSLELGMITGKEVEDEEELKKCKQRLVDKVRKEMRQAKRQKQKKK